MAARGARPAVRVAHRAAAALAPRYVQLDRARGDRPRLPGRRVRYRRRRPVAGAASAGTRVADRRSRLQPGRRPADRGGAPRLRRLPPPAGRDARPQPALRRSGGAAGDLPTSGAAGHVGAADHDRSGRAFRLACRPRGPAARAANGACRPRPGVARRPRHARASAGAAAPAARSVRPERRGAVAAAASRRAALGDQGGLEKSTPAPHRDVAAQLHPAPARARCSGAAPPHRPRRGPPRARRSSRRAPRRPGRCRPDRLPLRRGAEPPRGPGAAVPRADAVGAPGRARSRRRDLWAAPDPLAWARCLRRPAVHMRDAGAGGLCPGGRYGGGNVRRRRRRFRPLPRSDARRL